MKPQHQFWKSAKRHKFRGEWMTVKQIAELVGVTECTVSRRIRLGIPIEGRARFGPAPRRFEFRGRLATIEEIMADTGLSRSQVSKRTDGIKFFERHELADPNAPPHPNNRMLFFQGTSDSISGWARRTGIPHYVIGERINSLGWPLKRALTEPVMRQGQRILYQRNAEIIRRMLDRFHISSPPPGGDHQLSNSHRGPARGAPREIEAI